MTVYGRVGFATIRRLLKELCAFISKHRDKISGIIGPDNTVLLDAIVLACNAFMPVLDEFDPVRP